VAPPHTRRLLHLFARVLRTGEGEEVVLKVGFADDGAHWFQVSASAVGGDVSVTFMDITRERQRQQVVARQAHQDVLTGLLNRRGLELNGGRLLQRARATGGRVGLLFLDLDDFKQVNDRYGHARGDALLRAFAGRLRGCVRRGDVVARFGGDEFVVLVQVKEPADIREAANRIRELGRLPYRFEGASLTSAPSVGVAFLGADGGSLHELIRAADRDMYRVKKAGRS
jgi:diguanylate cyclase (GGDEF)-like protein